MKMLFVFAGLLIASISYAQDGKDMPFKSATELLKRNPIPGKLEFQFPSSVDKELVIVKDAGVIQLPLDHMPCLVPDVSGFNMPIANKVVTSNMPVLKFKPTK